MDVLLGGIICFLFGTLSEFCSGGGDDGVGGGGDVDCCCDWCVVGVVVLSFSKIDIHGG